MSRRLAISLAFVAVCMGVAVVPTVYAAVAQQHCCLVNAAGGVTSLNTETGDITLTSTGGSLTITPSGQTIDLAAVPIPCPTAGTNVTITGTSMPACTINASGGGGGGTPTITASPPVTVATPTADTFIIGCGTGGAQCLNGPPSAACSGPCTGVVLQPVPTTSPKVQNGGIAVTGPVYIVPSPYPTASTAFLYDAVDVQTGTGQCESGNYVAWGTSANTVQTVVGQLFSLGCADLPNTTFLTIGGHGDIGTQGNLYLNGGGSGAGNIVWTNAASSDQNCLLYGHGTGFGYIDLTASGGASCTFGLPSLPHSSALCVDTSDFAVEPCSGLTTNVGEVTCSAIAGSCTTTVTVRSGAKCQATMDTDSTLAGPYYAPVVHTTTTTLSITLTAVVAGGGGDLSANYNCP